MPKWLKSIDQFTPERSFGIGAALSAINPKNLAMSLGAGLSIAQAAEERAVAWFPAISSH
jgi:hypothetical protein